MNEVTNRQVFVVDTTHTVEAKEQRSMNKIGFLYTELNGKQISTDMIQMGQIRQIRISKPAGAVFKKWTLSVPGSTVLTAANQGKNFQVYMHIRDFMGYDQYHEKFASIALSSKILGASSSNPVVVKDPSDGTTQSCTTSALAFAHELKKRINAQYINGYRPVKATVQSGKIVIEEVLDFQYPTLRKMERRIFPTPCNMYITTNFLEGEDQSWSAEVASAPNQRLEGVANVTFKNSYLVWRMERQATLDRNEMVLPDVCDPFLPTDLVMDNETWQTGPNNGNDYYFLDIAYWTQPKDVHAAVNNKEITFCSKTLSHLTAIANMIGTQIGNDSDITSSVHSIRYEPKSQLGAAAAAMASEE